MATTTAADPHDRLAIDARPNGGVQLRHIPLSRVVVPESFNPRGEVADDRELEQLADSIRADGCLQPIRVRATDHGDYILIAGERRYRAAVKGCVMELPAIIRPAGTGDDDEQSDLLVEALLENDLRRDLDPLARARGYQRLIDTGLSVKGVAERLQTTQARVREHLRILKLPEELQDKFACAEIPVRAVKSLGQLSGIHPGLAIAAAQQVLDPGDAYEPYAWADVERAPLEVALAGGELPEGIYRPHTAYPIAAFVLGEDASNDLAAIERMLGRPVEHVQFDGSDVAEARVLGAAHGENWHTVIVGNDVAAQLVTNYLARSVKELRKRAREERKLVRDTQASSNGSVGGGAADDNSTAGDPSNGTAVDPEETRRAEREAERHAREEATRFNLELGRAVFMSLSRVRVDVPVLKLLASVEIATHLADVAMRGARYGFPGWVTETAQKNGKAKYGYLEKPQAAERASDYLRGATKPGEIAGRQLALLAMATYADQNAVAISSRSWHEIKANGPWAVEADELLDKLVADNLPDGALALLEPMLEKRKAEQEERSAARRAREEAVSRLKGVEERIGELTAQELDQAEGISTRSGLAGRPSTPGSGTASPPVAQNSTRPTSQPTTQGRSRSSSSDVPVSVREPASGASFARHPGVRPSLRPAPHRAEPPITRSGSCPQESPAATRCSLSAKPPGTDSAPSSTSPPRPSPTRSNAPASAGASNASPSPSTVATSPPPTTGGSRAATKSPAGGPTSAKTPAKSSGSSASVTASSRTSRPSSSSIS
jgi:ParB/RepB/Spo0J family partition protein